jgi:N-acetylneuraminate synthase
VTAIAVGGAMIEKHLTLSRSDGGPDAAFSLEPAEFKRLVEDCKSAWAALGRVEYGLLGSERANLRFRRSLYAVKPIKAGEPISRDNVRSIRPGFGLAPKHLDAILGRKAARDIGYGEPLSWSLIV